MTLLCADLDHLVDASEGDVEVVVFERRAFFGERPGALRGENGSVALGTIKHV